MGVNSSSGRWTTLLGSLATFMISLELTVIAVALTSIVDHYEGVSRNTVSWVFTAYNVCVAGFLLIGGWLADRHGRLRVFRSGLVVFGLGSLAAGLAPSIWFLIGARVVQGLGGALLVPSSLALILHGVGEDGRDRAIGVWGAMSGLAAALGPLIGAVLLRTMGWQSVFLVNLPLVVFVYRASERNLDESFDPDCPRTVDMVAVPVGAVAVGLGVFTIVAGSATGWTSPTTLVAVASVLVLAAVFVWRTVSHPRPVFHPQIATQRSFLAGSVATLFFVAGFIGWLVFIPSFLTDVWGYSPGLAGLAMFPGPLCMALVAGPAESLTRTVGHRTVITIGTSASILAGVWLLASVSPEPHYLSDLAPGLVLMGLGVGAAYPMLAAVTVSDVSPRRYAIASAGSGTVRQVAMALGIAISAASINAIPSGSPPIDGYRLSWTLSLAGLAASLVAITFCQPAWIEDRR